MIKFNTCPWSNSVLRQTDDYFFNMIKCDSHSKGWCHPLRKTLEACLLTSGQDEDFLYHCCCLEGVVNMIKWGKEIRAIQFGKEG